MRTKIGQIVYLIFSVLAILSEIWALSRFNDYHSEIEMFSNFATGGLLWLVGRTLKYIIAGSQYFYIGKSSSTIIDRCGDVIFWFFTGVGCFLALYLFLIGHFTLGTIIFCIFWANGMVLRRKFSRSGPPALGAASAVEKSEPLNSDNWLASSQASLGAPTKHNKLTQFQIIFALGLLVLVLVLSPTIGRWIDFIFRGSWF